MRNVKSAYLTVQKMVEDTIFKITNCFETEDNFFFVLYLKDGSGTNLPPIQISKEENTEPDFYKGNFFLDNIESQEIPLESIV